MRYLKEFSTRQRPQTEPLSGQSLNNAGGYSWTINDWERLRRFLILGSEGGIYYVEQRKLTHQNAEATLRCIDADGSRAVDEIVTISKEGRAPKNDAAIFALALAASHGDDATRSYALSRLNEVCRIGTHLFNFASYIQQFRGWGRGLRNAVGEWYNRPDLAYQLVKYRQRNGWTHRDLLRLSHPKPKNEEQRHLLRWATGKELTIDDNQIINAYCRAQAATTPEETVTVIRSCPDLPREALQPEHLTSPAVWSALVDNGMPMTAVLRNLPTMTRTGLITPTAHYTSLICEQLTDPDRLKKARVHPLSVLVALETYRRGTGYRGNATWTPVPQIIDALDEAFYAAFGNVTATSQRMLLALDVSGSMSWGEIAGMPGITPRVASAAMALLTASVEKNYHIMGFSHEFVPLTISPRQRLDDAVRAVSSLPFSGTDCSLPMEWALQTRTEIDTFVVYTDSETWYGDIHPAQALMRYREKMGINAKLVVVGMVGNEFSIADPADPGMLDLVGFDTAAPNLIAEFTKES